MTTTKTYSSSPFRPPESHKPSLSPEAYERLYEESLKNPTEFWKQQAQRLEWIKPFTKVQDTSFDLKNFRIRWFEDGTLNACANCLDRHVSSQPDKVALIWEGNKPEEIKTFTYAELYQEVIIFSNTLKSLGVQKEDRVVFYMPMIPEAVMGMLACARIGAIHSVVFGGFSSKALGDRIQDCNATWVITADGGFRGEKMIPLKKKVDEALEERDPSGVKKVLVVRHTGAQVPMKEHRDVWYHEVRQIQNTPCPPEEMNAEDPLFILYTSGSTGKPKAIVHATGGYMVYASLTHEKIFDLQPEDIFWCTADVGWITGHTYLVYGPLANGATILMYEGIPTYPDAARFWNIIDRHGVTIFYTAPTALRALMAEGDGPLQATNRHSLRVLGSVGEPINLEAWEWFYHKVGNSRCPIMDTWWQTETGGVMITPLPGPRPLKPGAALRPFFGVQPVLLDGHQQEIIGPGEGQLVLKGSWPGQMRTIFRQEERFLQTYFTENPGYYTSGDGARRDEEGDLWITGRLDDVINVSGHRLGTAEIESALDSHPQVAESAVVGFPHPVKGEGIYAYVVLKKGESPPDTLEQELTTAVQTHIGSLAKPDVLHTVQDLPKTRSGKIMRRILRKIAAGQTEDLGDTSTLANPEVVEQLVEEGKKRKRVSVSS